MLDVDDDRAPLRVIWEVTRGCALWCRHCRAATPATSRRLTRGRMAPMQAAGLDQVALSTDAPTRAAHAGFRRVSTACTG